MLLGSLGVIDAEAVFVPLIVEVIEPDMERVPVVDFVDEPLDDVDVVAVTITESEKLNDAVPEEESVAEFDLVLLVESDTDPLLRVDSDTVSVSDDDSELVSAPERETEELPVVESLTLVVNEPV